MYEKYDFSGSLHFLLKLTGKSTSSKFSIKKKVYKKLLCLEIALSYMMQNAVIFQFLSLALCASPFSFC